MSSPVLVLGTRNRKKGRELAELLLPHGLEVRTLDDYSAAVDVEETGDTFAANAALKAQAQARALGEWVLADDSGLSVDVLGGAPGVHSARFAGPLATDSDNNRLLLENLRAVPLERRTAHYTCHVVLADRTGEIRARSEAYCHGRIVLAASGEAGFGYDPYFEIVEYHRTFGALGGTVKTVLSHRARALEGILPHVINLVRSERRSHA